jgi:hypothetical protein
MSQNSHHSHSNDHNTDNGDHNENWICLQLQQQTKFYLKDPSF